MLYRYHWMLPLRLPLNSRYPSMWLYIYHFTSFHYLVYMLMYFHLLYSFTLFHLSLLRYNLIGLFHNFIHLHYLMLGTVPMLCFLRRSLFIMCWMHSLSVLRYLLYMSPSYLLYFILSLLRIMLLLLFMVVVRLLYSLLHFTMLMFRICMRSLVIIRSLRYHLLILLPMLILHTRFHSHY